MIRTVAAIVLALLALSACGRRAAPLPPTPEGQTPRIVVQPDKAGTARGPRIVPQTSDLSVVPAEVTRNPNSKRKGFVLDGLLN